MPNFWDKREIYVSITTITDGWKKKISDINKLGIEKVALFLTGIDYNKIPKDYFFNLIEKSCIKEIPFAHIYSKTSPKDIKYLKTRFKTTVFNIHSELEYPQKYNLSKYKKEIYLETLFKYPLTEEELNKYAGICIDISHMEISKNDYPEVYKKNSDVIKKYKCGCNHISAYKLDAIEEADRIKDSSHFFTNLSQFDYLLDYPSNYFSNVLALELENDIEDQIKAKEYIINLLKNKS
ncbi:MAG: hypothetical protein ABIJ05_00005 [Patescibacteria group bacterium]